MDFKDHMGKILYPTDKLSGVTEEEMVPCLKTLT